MQRSSLLTLILIAIATSVAAQGYTPKIEYGPCMIKIDSGVVAKCGYLIVPENRQGPRGRTIKLPFVFIRRDTQDAHKNIALLCTGGPGYSTTRQVTQVKYRSDYLSYGGFIFLDQRGTKNTVPCLTCEEVQPAIQRAYRERLSVDSMRLLALRACRKRLAGQGIDLSAYNTIESAEDINDLRKALTLDSLYLVGISYSGGLMLTVARNHPEAVKALLLNSPLPGFVNYEEHALFNMNEALEQVFSHCEKDSAQAVYKNLRNRFHQYFTDITGKTFTMHYLVKKTNEDILVDYTKQQLMDAVIDRLNERQVKEVPFVMLELINGHHEAYVKESLDNVFSDNTQLAYGMRLSVYCSEQIAYSSEDLVRRQYEVLPWFAGYAFNNVNHAICKCWEVQPEPASAKTPVYSNVPALISAGDIDPWCPSFYNVLIKRTMPNSQLLLIHDRGHGPGFGVKGASFLDLFMADPYKKLVSPVGEVIVQ
ncbi:alpha/beta fold hydrolase [Chitinophaga vietnamensis]|uniref:alpha/beta fold hydrolase n=1 Tax=Chitinophaga vietnamensis TaxID=2593957 RepID=UPI001177F27A|nr:alpha/beta fold hydrolase [Chitinophaga vietnamensis]